MHATRILRTGSGLLSKPPKLLLPQPTMSTTVYHALQGWWALLSDQSSRDAYERAVQTSVIKDSVLSNASLGSVITYSLFHNLQNPLFRKYGFDAKLFVDTVGPALVNFHDTLGCLRNELPDIVKQEEEEKKKKEGDRDSQKAEEASSLDEGNNTSTLNVLGIEPTLGVNRWRDQANRDGDGLAGRLSKMTDDFCMEALYFRSKLEILTRAALVETSPDDYVPGSCKVNDVALLNARAMRLDKEGHEAVNEFSEFEASEEEESKETDNSNVVAQIDVLYEVTHEFVRELPASVDIMASMASVPTTRSETKASSSGTANEESTSTENNVEEQTQKEETPKEKTTETISYTNLAVAVFEGWLHRKSDGKSNDLRWKISALGDAYMFPHHQATVSHKPAP